VFVYAERGRCACKRYYLVLVDWSGQGRMGSESGPAYWNNRFNLSWDEMSKHRLRRPRPGPPDMTEAEKSLVHRLQQHGQLASHLEAERSRLLALLRAPWIEEGTDRRFMYLATAQDVQVEGMTQPHPHLRVVFIPAEDTRLRLAYAIPLVDSYGEVIQDPIADLQEALDAWTLRGGRRLSAPDDAGLRWLAI
jgi:hypothetical protein